jgi:hypothetical protein
MDYGELRVCITFIICLRFVLYDIFQDSIVITSKKEREKERERKKEGKKIKERIVNIYIAIITWISFY